MTTSKMMPLSKVPAFIAKKRLFLQRDKRDDFLYLSPTSEVLPLGSFLSVFVTKSLSSPDDDSFLSAQYLGGGRGLVAGGVTRKVVKMGWEWG